MQKHRKITLKKWMETDFETIKKYWKTLPDLAIMSFGRIEVSQNILKILGDETLAKNNITWFRR